VVRYINDSLKATIYPFLNYDLSRAPCIHSFIYTAIAAPQFIPIAIRKALDLLEQGHRDFIENNDNQASYNTTPSLKEAWEYRKRVWKK
jgi:hypothetical protein